MRSSVDVHNYLVERDVQHELFRVQGRLRTPERLAAVLDLPPEEVGKVAVFESDQGPLLALVPSNTTPDPTLVQRAANVESVKKASPARASALSDYIPDAIPPVALPKGFRVLMDTSLAEREVVYFHAGDSAAVLKVRGADLAGAAEATVAPLA